MLAIVILTVRQLKLALFILSADEVSLFLSAEKIYSESLIASALATKIHNQIARSDCLSESPAGGLSPLKCQFATPPLQGVNVRWYLY